ncbi:MULTISPECIES: hypothetical protein [unclassified Paenibacillus]|uniref:hypothetical protein n=1 Tax=unclassified Paenibacillus TaxID=185978 RepID=UPI001AE37979|nr:MULTISPECIES: hypothetical protein [unclassified Paenibacillus]MBP1154479.1 hypothetical protein [Paenibacillus sp. PvP091]MBP1170137.1 hypothetical protein [Paenibacillus sp. PvR098]MBP2441165.1 hypothetical protein [Paenibacillus sp. PvP052]
MGQLKVRFTIEHSSQLMSFTNRTELEKHPLSYLFITQLNEFERKLKYAAADHWLKQRLGYDSLTSFRIQ